MSSASSAVTYTSVYTDSEPGRVFWGADEELSDGDEHILLAEEQPLPHVVSPTAESPEYVAESDPEEDPEEYKDDETDDDPVDYPMDEGDDGDDDDDGDSSGENADDEDEDEEEDEEHLAPADSAVVIPTDELVFSPEGAEFVIPPPFTDTTTIGARITVRLQAAISFPPEAEVKRLLAMPTPSPSPLASLSPPSTGERLARCTALAALPSPPLPPPLHMPPPVDRRDDIPEIEMPPRKRLCLSTLGSRYEVGESSTARPTGGRGIDYGFVSTLDTEARRRRIREVGYGIRDTWVDPTETVPEIAPMTVGEVNTKVTELAELHEHDTHDLYALLKDAQDTIDSCETAQEIWLRVQQMMKGSDIRIQEKNAKLFNEWEREINTFQKRLPVILDFLNNLQPEWSRHVTIIHQTKDLHIADYTQLYDFLKYNQKEVDELKTKRLAKTQDPLALMATSNNPYNIPVLNQDQPSFNQNYMQQPMPNPEDITDPTTAINMSLALMAKAFKLNYSTPTKNNQRISSNPRNRQIAQLSMNMGQDMQMQMVGRGVGHFARNCTVRPRRRDVAYLQTQLLIAQKEDTEIQLQAEEFKIYTGLINRTERR
uniref:Gag-Pol polyprotein n=1 Tax=Tanacetum cinerariifolium TaxID=118510 RepID=A0A699I7M3_TANCI|nr:hypothetical protein [Tanacetum cinerariifolium]